MVGDRGRANVVLFHDPKMYDAERERERERERGKQTEKEKESQREEEGLQHS